MRLPLLLMSLVVFCLSCKTAKKTIDESDNQVSSTLQNENLSPDDIVFALKKGACYGTCPVYTLRIYNNQYAEFTGVSHTDKQGIHGKMISKQEYKDLKKQFDDSDFFAFDDLYPSDISDLPSAKLTYQKGDKKKTVAGKRERPEALHKLQFSMEKIVESKGWKLVKSTEEMIAEQPKIDKSKVVVTIAKGNEMARWFSMMRKKFGVQMLESLTPNNDTWLIKFDPKDHDPDKFLELLNIDPVISKAEFYQPK